MLFISPGHFPDYELLDSGEFEKLERFGKYITIRPEPQAVWSKTWTTKDWENRSHVRFIPKSSSTGTWKKLKEMPDQWEIRYQPGFPTHTKFLVFRLGLTAFKHVGVFPEQAVNWDYLYGKVKSVKVERPKVLNLFAYTGGASLAACAAGAEVTHLDSVKQVITWARQNMEKSGLDGIRWIVDDAMTFVKRELRRGNTYHGIILDPPAYGHGANGEKWKLEDMISEMVMNVTRLLEPDQHFILLNTYSLGFSPLIIENLFHQTMLKGEIETGEIFLRSETGTNLPLGVFGRSR